VDNRTRTEKQHGQPRINKPGWFELFDLVASQSELTDDVISVIKLLKLPLGCHLAVQKVLQERNWVTSDDPRAYIKRAAMTQARKMHLSVPYADDTLECGGGSLVFMGGDAMDRATTRDAIERSLQSEDCEHGAARPKKLKGKHYVEGQHVDPFSSDLLYWDNDFDDREREAAERRPSWPSDCWTSGYKRDWKKLGEKVGLHFWAIKVLEYRSAGISRDQAINAQPDEICRKAIQAAWRYMDRTGFQKVRDYLRKISDEMSRNLDSETLENEGVNRLRDSETSLSKHRDAVRKFLSKFPGSRGKTPLWSVIRDPEPANRWTTQFAPSRPVKERQPGRAHTRDTRKI